jgi:hypothetical protein
MQSKKQDGRHWLILDEINRADIDRALGPVFTALQDYILRLPEEIDGSREFRIPAGFRVIATMNTIDKNNLFPMSVALMRRFAIINLEPILDIREEDNIIDFQLRHFLETTAGITSSDSIARVLNDASIQSLKKQALNIINRLRKCAKRLDSIEVPELMIGTATAIEICKFSLCEILRRSDGYIRTENTILDRAFRTHLLPQIEGLDHVELKAVEESFIGPPLLKSCLEIVRSWAGRNAMRV